MFSEQFKDLLKKFFLVLFIVASVYFVFIFFANLNKKVDQIVSSSQVLVHKSLLNPVISLSPTATPSATPTFVPLRKLLK